MKKNIDLRADLDFYLRNEEFLFRKMDCNEIFYVPLLNSHYKTTPLIHAVISRNYELAKNLLKEKDLNINFCTKDGDNALLLAVVSMHSYEITKLLLENGADPNIEYGNGATLLFQPIVYCYDNDLKKKLMGLLIEHGANVNKRDNFGFTPLLQAVIVEDVVRVELLLENRADLTLKYDSERIMRICNVKLDIEEVDIFDFAKLYCKHRAYGEKILSLLQDYNGGKHVKVASYE